MHDGPATEEITYEGYGPGGVAILVHAHTDNRNRTSAEVRVVFSKHGGNMGQSGSVAWLFHERGQFVFDAGRFSEDELMEAALEAGAEDVAADGDVLVMLCEPTAFARVMEHLDKHGLGYREAQLTRIPETTVKVTGEDAAAVLRLVERLEQLEDVQKVYANFDIDEAGLAVLAGG